jgi:hypothetical protein
MPVYKLAEEMPYEEFLGWINYFERRPVDWRDDDRTMKLLQVQGVKEKPWALFQSLHAIYKGSDTVNEDGSLNANSLKTSTLFNKMLSAKGGEKLDL